ncbi:DDE-type integrase/transposase/recombinase [Labilibacter sediminis]|nr:DDE-type integrase/transposase/recombinase [Labilibacter sediminis]
MGDNNDNATGKSATRSSQSNFNLMSLLNREKLTGPNYLDWIRALRIALRFEDMEYVLDEDLPILSENPSTEESEAYLKHDKDSTKVACLMLATMSSELQKSFENMGAFDINSQLMDMFQVQAMQEQYDVVQSLVACKQKDGAPVSPHVLKMKGYIDRLVNLGMEFPKQLGIHLVLGSLNRSFEAFVMNYNMNNMEKTLLELHGMLKTAESNMKKCPPVQAPVLSIDRGAKKRKASYPQGKGKAKKSQKKKGDSDIAPTSDPNEAICFYCQQKGHWKRACPKYREDLKLNKAKGASTSGTFVIEFHNTVASNSWVLDTGCGTHICTDLQGLKRSRSLKTGELNLIMGNRRTAPVTKIGDYEFKLSDRSIILSNVCYSPSMARNIISFHALWLDGFTFGFDNNNGDLLVYKDDCYYFKASPHNGVYESIVCVRNNNLTNNVDVFNNELLDKSKLWHCRLGHINKNRITKLQSDGILESFEFKSDDVCESCLLGKMTKSPFTGNCERGNDLLELIHTDVCGPFRTATKIDKKYFVTFTDDYSRYGFVFLTKHKHETFEVFKRFQNEVENQLGKKIKILRSDRGGEYLSQEFIDHLRDCGIVSQLSPPRTPQHNGVSERRNRTLLDMVRSMMSRATLPIYFWGYALETAAHILNLVPTKKVAKTPHEMWTGKPPSLGHIKVWGCEAFVRRDASDKLEPRSERCHFIGYPQNSFGYLFYKSSEDKVFVARRGVFLERDLISKEVSGSTIDLEEIQEQVTEGTLEESSIQPEESVSVEPTDISLPLRRSSRVRIPPEFYGLHITEEEDEYISDRTLVNLDEPANYKEAMAGPEASKWKEAMDSEIKSMYDNQVWNLVDNVPGRKTVGCKWIFKKKMDMHGNVQTFKARLVAKGFTQTFGVDYDETFSPVAKIKSIRIMLAIAAFHDYEVWQMDVKTAFLNGKLAEDVYMSQPEGFVNAKFPNRVCKLEKSIYGLKQASRRWNLCFHEKVIEFGFSRSEDESCVYVKASGSIVTFLVLYVDDILLIGNNIPSLNEVKSWLRKCFAMKDLGEAAYILGIRILRDRKKRLIGLSQSTYLEKVLKKI